MISEDKEAFLSRWSRLKREKEPAPERPADPAPAPASTAPAPATGEAGPQLPPVESISLETDIKPFLQPEVDDALRRVALKKLFQDPHFNVMDGLDVYIDDYNMPDPLPESVLEQLQFAKDYVFRDPANPDPGLAESQHTAAADSTAASVAVGMDTTEAANNASDPNREKMSQGAPPERDSSA